MRNRFPTIVPPPPPLLLLLQRSRVEKSCEARRQKRRRRRRGGSSSKAASCKRKLPGRLSLCYTPARERERARLLARAARISSKRVHLAASERARPRERERSRASNGCEYIAAINFAKSAKGELCSLSLVPPSLAS